MSDVRILPLTDGNWLAGFFVDHWHADFVISNGRQLHARDLDAAMAERDGKLTGVISWLVTDDEMEIASLNALERHSGVGTMLLAYAVERARDMKLKRVHLITTNDNVDALRFYQRRGFRLCALRSGAMAETRRLKPDVPETGFYGIPLSDELELELTL